MHRAQLSVCYPSVYTRVCKNNTGRFTAAANKASCAAWASCNMGTYSNTPSSTLDRTCTTCPSGRCDPLLQCHSVITQLFMCVSILRLVSHGCSISFCCGNTEYNRGDSSSPKQRTAGFGGGECGGKSEKPSEALSIIRNNWYW